MISQGKHAYVTQYHQTLKFEQINTALPILKKQRSILFSSIFAAIFILY